MIDSALIALGDRLETNFLTAYGLPDSVVGITDIAYLSELAGEAVLELGLLFAIGRPRSSEPSQGVVLARASYQTVVNHALEVAFNTLSPRDPHLAAIGSAGENCRGVEPLAKLDQGATRPSARRRPDEDDVQRAKRLACKRSSLYAAVRTH